jgi:DNA-binding transcriptional LysR family regulator
MRRYSDVNVDERLDWNLLRTFLVIAREKSVSRAAERLHLSQPAVSNALRRLEEQLGLRLIARKGPRIEITLPGAEVMQIAEEAYGTISRLSRATFNQDSGITGLVKLRIVSGLDFPEYDLFLASFHRHYPGIEFECQVMRSADVVNSLRQKSATIGLSPRRTVPESISDRLFLRQRYALFCGIHHPFFGREDLQPVDMSAERLVTFSGDKIGDHLSALTMFRDEYGFIGQISGSSSNVSEVKRLIIAGFGLGFLPEHTTYSEIDRGELRRLPPADGVADIDIYLLWNLHQKFTEAESLFLNALNAFLDRYRPLEDPTNVSGLMISQRHTPHSNRNEET